MEVILELNTYCNNCGNCGDCNPVGPQGQDLG